MITKNLGKKVESPDLHKYISRVSNYNLYNAYYEINI